MIFRGVSDSVSLEKGSRNRGTSDQNDSRHLEFTVVSLFIYLFSCYLLEKSLTLQFRLNLNSFCSPNWPGTCSDSPFSASPVLELRAGATTPGLTLNLDPDSKRQVVKIVHRKLHNMNSNWTSDGGY